MSATIVDIHEYRKKAQAAAEELQVHMQVELHIPAQDNGKNPPLTYQSVGEYESDLKEDFAKMETVIIKTLRNMKFRMMTRIAIMFVISVCISTGIIMLAL